MIGLRVLGSTSGAYQRFSFTGLGGGGGGGFTLGSAVALLGGGA